MSAGNTSHAVRAQRVEAHDSLDYFPTPPWATRALCRILRNDLGEDLSTQDVWEPACGEMHMVRPLAESFGRVVATDVQPYAAPLGGSACWDDMVDFTLPHDRPAAFLSERPDWIITNPPFNQFGAFVERAVIGRAAERGVALLVRTQVLHGVGRFNAIFRDYPPTVVLPFAERVVMLKGRLVSADWINPDSIKDDKKGSRYSTATDYCWFVWRFGSNPLGVKWIGPCRKALERPGDYPEPTEIERGAA